MFPGMIPVYKALFEDNDPNGRMIADALTPTVDIDFRRIRSG